MLHQGRLSRKSQLKHCNRWHQLYFLLPVDQVRLFGLLNLMNPHIWDHRIRVLNIRGWGPVSGSARAGRIRCLEASVSWADLAHGVLQ